MLVASQLEIEIRKNAVFTVVKNIGKHLSIKKPTENS